MEEERLGLGVERIQEGKEKYGDKEHAGMKNG